MNKRMNERRLTGVAKYGGEEEYFTFLFLKLSLRLGEQDY